VESPVRGRRPSFKGRNDDYDDNDYERVDNYDSEDRSADLSKRCLVGKSPAGGRDLYARIFSSALSSAFVALSTRDVANKYLAALIWSLLSSCIIDN